MTSFPVDHMTKENSNYVAAEKLEFLTDYFREYT